MTTKLNSKFPLWLHPSGQWCKKYHGKAYYFGIDKDAAEVRYRAEWDDIIQGKVRKQSADSLTVADAANHFLAEKKRKVESGELSRRTFADYFATCEAVVAALGRDRGVLDLGPADFAKMRANVAKRVGPVSVLNFVTRVRVLFKFAYDFDLIPHPVRYGAGFDRPTKKVLRVARSQKGERMIEAVDLNTMLDHADVQMRAMMLLALNGGLGATDCSQLTRGDLAKRPGWLELARAKTGMARRFQLWPETIAALGVVHPARPAAKDPIHADLVFLTRLGQPWTRFTSDGMGKRSVQDSTSAQFSKLAAACGVKLTGRFYTLRHVFRTIADEVGDRPAIDKIMGHSDNSMADAYRERIADERLERVSNHVREWLLKGKPANAENPSVLKFKAS